ncbi:MAG: hypothetical protein WCI27_00905 [Candidatus Omnitrophota bacterium]
MGEHFIYWNEGFKFIGAFAVIVGLPCIAVAVLGTRMINHIGRYPTRSARMQLHVCLQLLPVQVLSFFLLWVFFRVLSN